VKIRSPLLHKLGGLLGAMTVRAWMSTMEPRVAYYDPSVDPAKREFAGPMIYLFWHEYLLIPLHFRGHCNLAMLLSQHRDGEMLSRAAYHLGFDVVRGSTTRGGVAALREMTRRARRLNLAITPDGPRGPRRVLAPGAVYLSSKLQMPLVAMGLACNRPWRMRSWDRFVVPRPFSRIRSIVGPPMQIPPDLDRDGVEHYRTEVQNMLNRLTEESEAWAEAGTIKAGEEPGRAPPARHLRRAA
jgi:lysophospholipid acyltransferase (LPLAT)-like uncharacterized protein